MAKSGTTVHGNRGTLTFGAAIGFVAEAFTLIPMQQFAPILVEDYGAQPLDYIYLGGEILGVVVGTQWDAATRNALAKHLIVGSTLVFDVDLIGRRMGDIANAAVTWTPTDSGSISLSAPKAVPLLSRGRRPEIRLGVKAPTLYAATLAMLPDGNGDMITISTSA